MFVDDVLFLEFSLKFALGRDFGQHRATFHCVWAGNIMTTEP